MQTISAPSQIRNFEFQSNHSFTAVLPAEGYYFIFDCPGQVELFMLHDSLRAVLNALTGKWSYRLTAVHLVDAHLCTDPPKYISALLLSLSTMLHLELPHVNVLSKMDLVQQYGNLAFNLDYYTGACYSIQGVKCASRRHRRPKLLVVHAGMRFSRGPG